MSSYLYTVEIRNKIRHRQELNLQKWAMLMMKYEFPRANHLVLLHLISIKERKRHQNCSLHRMISLTLEILAPQQK